jgi:hypothetical protein
MAGGRQSEGREVGEEGSTRLTASVVALSFGRMEDAEQRGRKGGGEGGRCGSPAITAWAAWKEGGAGASRAQRWRRKKEAASG